MTNESAFEDRAAAGRMGRVRQATIIAAWTFLAILGCSSGGHEDSPPSGPQESVVATENRKPGSDGWQFWRHGYAHVDDATEQVKGYASATSVNHGDAITFFVSVNPPQAYAIDVYRIGWYGGLGGALVTQIGPLDGVRQPECPVVADTGLIACDWSPSYTLAVPSSWVSGVYLGVVRNQQRFASFVLFVVRADERGADILYQQSATTYQAYNDYPSDGVRGKSLYGSSFGPVTLAGNTRAVQVSFDRPYANDGAGQFLEWEIDFVRWLEHSGYDVSYSTDVDTHLHGERLLASKAFLSVGHDEYWSRPMLDAVLRARDAGVHLGFFGANDAYWQIRFAPAASGTPDRIMVCYKDAALDPVQSETLTVHWRDPRLGRPEQSLIGIQSGDIIAGGIHGAYGDYVVRNSSHWVYAGTGLREGDVIAGVVGYETDALDASAPHPAALGDGTTVLSASPYTSFGGTPATANSAIYQAPSGAWVFAAGSIGWSLGLDDFGSRAKPDDRLQRASSNILDAFVRGKAQ